MESVDEFSSWTRREMGWIGSQFLQGAPFIQLSLALQNLIHVLRELGVERLGDLAWFANYQFPVSFAVHTSSGHHVDNTSQVLTLTSAALDDYVVEGMCL